MVFPNLTRSLAALLSAVLFLTNCALAHSAEMNIWSERRQNRPVQLAALPTLPQPALSAVRPNTAIPNAYGSFRKLAPTLNAAQKTVIHIQDIHQNFEAQGNIGKAIREWLNDKNIGLIALEGASGDIDLKRFQTFSDQNIIRTVSNYLLKQNRISGPIHTALVNDHSNTPIIGIDDETHYRANIDAYKAAAAHQKARQEEWHVTSLKTNEEKQKIFNPALLAFDAQVQSYRNEKISLSVYLKHLKAKSGSSSMVDVFLEALEMEEHLDFKKAEIERSRLISNLVSKLSETEAARFADFGNRFKTGALRQTDFYEHLLTLCSAKNITMTSYPALDNYIRYLNLSDTIDTDKLFSDMREREATFYALLAKTSAERSLIQRDHELYLTGKLLNFSLTKEEWENFKETPPSLPTSLRGEEFEKFYREAEIRDGAMAENLLREMKRTNAQTAVLVTGGFHSKGIDQALKQAGINTVTFVPKITNIDSVDGTHYLTAFTQERSPLDQLFSGKKLFLALPPAEGVKELPLLAATLTSNPQATMVQLMPGIPLRMERIDNTSSVVTNTTNGTRRRIAITLRAGEIVDVVVDVLKGRRKFQIPFVVEILEAITHTGQRVFAGIHLDWRGWLNKPLKMSGTAVSWPMTDGVFTQTEVDAVFQTTGLDRGQLQREFEKFGFYEEHLRNLRATATKAAAQELILSKPYITAINFPMAYNAVARFFTVTELIDLFLGNETLKQHEKATYAPGLLLWISLFRSHLGENGIQTMLDRLLQATKTDVEEYQRNFSKHLSLSANFWVHDVEPSWAQQRMHEMVTIGTDYAMLHFLPWADIPDNIKAVLKSRVLMSWDDIPVMEDIHPVKNQDLAAGTCPWCPRLHWDSLMDPKSRHYEEPAYGKVGIIRVNGRALFSLKLHRNPSMVALQTTRTPDGRFATIQGALYVPPKALRELFADFEISRETFRIVDISGPLDILPIGWLDFTSYREKWPEEKRKEFQARLSELSRQYSITPSATPSITATAFQGRLAWLKNLPAKIVFAPAVVTQELLHILGAKSLGLPVSYHLPELFSAVNINYDRAPPLAKAFVRLAGPIGNLLIGLAGLPFLNDMSFPLQYFFVANLVLALLDAVLLPALSPDLYNRSDIGLAILDLNNPGPTQPATAGAASGPITVKADRRGWLPEPLFMNGKARGSSKNKPVFEKKQIEKILNGEGKSFDALLQDIKEIKPDDFASIRKIKSRDQALTQIPHLSFVCSELFPYVYNQLSSYISVSEFLILIVRNQSTDQRTRGLLRWWPLIKPRLKQDEVKMDIFEYDDDIILTTDGLLHRLKKVDLLDFYTNLALFPNSWLETISPDFSEEIFSEMVRKNLDFPVYHFAPFEKAPVELKKKRSGRIPTSLRSLPSVANLSLSPKMERYAGTCQDCQQLHWETLVNTSGDDYGKVAIVRVGGRPLFSLKLVQDPSMVALETTTDAQGRILTIKGGVYTSRQVMEALPTNKKLPPFALLDINTPIRIYPLAWIDSASNGNTWDKNKFQLFLKKLDAIRKSYSAKKPQPDALSLLQGPVEAAIHKLNWTGWKARLPRLGMAFVISPLWEEAVFRMVMIGVWQWDPLFVGFLFFTLHIPQNVIFSLREAHHHVDLDDESFPENFVRTWHDAFTLRLYFQFVGVLILTYCYVNFSSYWVVVGIHSAFNVILKAIGMPYTYLSLLDAPRQAVSHPERETNIAALAKALGRSSDELQDAYDTMVGKVYAHTYQRNGIFPTGFDSAELVFHRSYGEALGRTFGEEIKDEEKPLHLRLTPTKLTVLKPGRPPLELEAKETDGTYWVHSDGNWMNVEFYIQNILALKLAQPLEEVFEELETGGVFQNDPTTNTLNFAQTGSRLTVTFSPKGELLTTGIPADPNFSFRHTSFGFHFHPRSNGMMSDGINGDKEEFAQRQKESGRKAIEIIFVTPEDGAFNNVPYSIEHSPIFLPIRIPGTDHILLGLLYTYERRPDGTEIANNIPTVLKSFLDQDKATLAELAERDYFAKEILKPMKVHTQFETALWGLLYEKVSPQGDAGAWWKEIGWEREYRQVFPKDEDFWTSEQSLYDIYQQIKNQRITNAFLNMDRAALPFALTAADQEALNAKIEVIKKPEVKALLEAALGDYEADAFAVLLAFLGIKPMSFVNPNAASVVALVNRLAKDGIKTIPIKNDLFVVNESPLSVFDPRRWNDERWNVVSISADPAIQAEMDKIKVRVREARSLESLVPAVQANLYNDDLLPGILLGFGVAANATFKIRGLNIQHLKHFDLETFTRQQRFHNGLPLHLPFLPDMVLPEDLNEPHIQTMGIVAGHSLARISNNYFWYVINHRSPNNGIPSSIFTWDRSPVYLSRMTSPLAKHLLHELQTADPNVGYSVSVPFQLPPALEPGNRIPTSTVVDHLFSFNDGESHIPVLPPSLAQHPATHFFWNQIAPHFLRNSFTGQALFTSAIESIWLLIPNLIFSATYNANSNAAGFLGLAAILNSWIFAKGHKNITRSTAAMLALLILGNAFSAFLIPNHAIPAILVMTTLGISHFMFDRRRLVESSSDGFPSPQSLKLKSFLQKIDAADFPRERKPWAETLVDTWMAVHEKRVPLVAALHEAKLLDLKRPNVIVLSKEQNTSEVRRILITLAKGPSKVFVVVEGVDVLLVNGQVRASDVDAALQKSDEWRQLTEQMRGTEETINIVKPSAFAWVNDVKVGSPLSRVQQILILEELLQVLSFLTSSQPSVEMLKRAADAVARAA